MKNKILMGVSILMGLMMIIFGLNKFFDFMPAPPPFPEDAGNLMSAFIASGWVMPLVAFAEIIGGALLIAPKTRALGAIVLFPVIVGIFIFHATMAAAGLPLAIVLIAINGWIIFENKDKYMPMIN